MVRVTIALAITAVWCLLATTKVTAASVGVAVAGSAYLLPWYFGVIDVLMEEGLYVPAVTPSGGLSGGAYTVMLTCAGATPQQLQQAFGATLRKCWADWNKTSGLFPCQGDLDAVLYNLAKNSTSGSDVADKCSDKVRVAYTSVDPNDATMNTVTPVIQTVFDNNTDVVNALVSTSFISCFSACAPYSYNRGMATVDGGYSATLDDLCPDNVDTCIKVQVYYPNTTNKGVECNVQNDPNPPTDFVEQCYEYFNGTGSVTNAVCSVPLPSEFAFEPVGSLPSSCPAGPSSFTGPGEADIYPGRFVALPDKFSCFYWQCLSYFPAEDPDILYDLGRQEALAWVAWNSEESDTPASFSQTTIMQSSLLVLIVICSVAFL